jgi:hypothetical protein
MKKHKFLSTFSNIKLRPIVSEEKDKFLSKASIEKLKKFIPDINTNDNLDLLPVAFDACVVNRVNKNGDVIDSSAAVKMVKNFINKPINIEHDRSIVVGCILNANFSKFGTNEELSIDEAKTTKDPFNITLGGIIWRIVNQDLADKLEEANDPTSENYMSISASWELGFEDFNILVLEENQKNIENGVTVSDSSEIEKYRDNLRGFGGSGKIKNNKYIYRQIIGRILPLGIGLTLNPAADVKGVAVASEILNENNISQDDVLNVKKDRIYMKISKIEEITDALLKEVSAASVTDFIAEEIKKVNDQYLAEKAEKENALKAADEKLQTISKEHDALKTNLEEVNKKLTNLEKEKEIKAKEEAFNMRMSAFDEEFELNEDERKVIASDIKDLNEEAFSAYKNKMSVFMKDKNKAAKKAAKEKAEKEAEMKNAEKAEATVVKTVVASEEVAQPVSTTQEVVEQAVDNGSKASTEIPNTAPAADLTVKEKYAKAFGLEGFVLK